jgi:hypothetical protein
MPCLCFCEKCQGSVVSQQTKLNHERKQLKTQTISGQFQRKREVTPAAQDIAGPSSFVSSVHPRNSSGISAHSPGISGQLDTLDFVNEPGSLAQAFISVSDLDVSTDVIYGPVSGIPSGAVDVNQEDEDGEYVHNEDDVGFPDVDAPSRNADLEDESDQLISLGPLVTDSTEDNPDPFIVKDHTGQVTGTANRQEFEIPDYLLVVYAIIAWLYFQFHLPCVACNALLASLACLLRFFDPTAMAPFITLQSATCALGVDPRIQLLAVCPKCRDVYPSSESRHAQDKCTTCQTPLFLPDHTRQGNQRTFKTPVIKYPYLPLSDQIISTLKIPGVETLLDDWRAKPRIAGEYSDIFDGNMCRLKLRAPDGSLFFSNRPHERRGPNGELRIGVNLGVDWYVLLLSLSDLTDNLVLGFHIFVAISHHLTRRVQPRFQFAIYRRSFGGSCFITHYTLYLIF